ncbi:MAG: SRPBCC domain-containing protein [Siphonobacter sp.]
MNSNLKFDFTVNKENNTIVINREFAANLELVWQAWTTAELLDQWWGPGPCRAKTKTLDFREGGHWLYCMIVPASAADGETEQFHWGKWEYEKIVLHKNFSGTDVFCDENGNANPELPTGKFENQFNETDGKTTVTMISTHQSFEDIETLIAMGFKEGITVCFNQLDELLKHG